VAVLAGYLSLGLSPRNTGPARVPGYLVAVLAGYLSLGLSPRNVRPATTPAPSSTRM
jgi:hypothetical protein